jgi:hypothetical protein
LETRVTNTLPIAESDVTGLVADLAAKAPLVSPTFTGHPVGVTEAALTNSTRFATTAYMDAAVGVETSRATAAEALLAPKASPTFTGTVTTPNGVGATNLAAYGQVPAPGTVGGVPKVVVRTSDSATRSTATFAVDDTLVWAVGANDRWIIQGFLTFTAADGAGAATTADAKVSFTVPASGSMLHGFFGVTNNGNPSYGSVATGSTPAALKAATSAQAIGAAALSFGVSIAGYYTGGGTAGTVSLEWAQNTTNAATLLLAKNSVLLLWRIA